MISRRKSPMALTGIAPLWRKQFWAPVGSIKSALADHRIRQIKAAARGTLTLAPDVGYESEAAFNRAFKRESGLPPAQYRRRWRNGEITHR